MKKQYTKLEIKLYERLTQIILAFGGFSEKWKDSVINYKDNKKIRKTIEEFVNLSNLIGDTKIPKKFLILNKLGEKNGNKV